MAFQRRELELTAAAEREGVLCLRVRGYVSRDKAKLPPDPLLALLGSRGHAVKILLDLAEADFLDSSGYSWLLDHDSAFRDAGGGMALHSVPRLVKNVLDTMRAELVLDIAADESAALHLLQNRPV
jgi:anti-anti-sigma factor